MIAGLGVDLVETARIRVSLERFGERFKKRVFLADEQAYCDGMADPAIHYAGRFAAKEAVSKAFGTGIGRQIGWLDIEVARNSETGEPSIRLHGKGLALLRARGEKVLVSLAHTKDYAVATVALAGNPKPDT